jgi:hypothetical protein
MKAKLACATGYWKDQGIEGSAEEAGWGNQDP